jgi:hypothetical protein
VDGLTPATNTTAPIRHLLPDFFEELSGKYGWSTGRTTSVGIPRVATYFFVPRAGRRLPHEPFPHLRR